MDNLANLKRQFRNGAMSPREFIRHAIDLLANDPIYLRTDQPACPVFGENGYLAKLEKVDRKVEDEYYDLAWEIFSKH